MLRLPREVTLGAVNAVANRVQVCDLPELHRLLVTSGVSRDQFQTRAELRDTLEKSVAAVCLKDRDNDDKMLAFFNITDSALSRSTDATMHAGTYSTEVPTACYVGYAYCAACLPCNNGQCYYRLPSSTSLYQGGALRMLSQLYNI